MNNSWNLVDNDIYCCPKCSNAYIYPENLIYHAKKEHNLLITKGE